MDLVASSASLRKTSVDLVPVDDIPPGIEILGTAVLVLQIVGMLPHVVAENGKEAIGSGVILVGRGGDLEFAAAKPLRATATRSAE